MVNAQNEDKVDLAANYLKQDEINKAKTIFNELAEDRKNISLIHNQYMGLLINNGFIDEGEEYINQVTQWFPENNLYKVDKGVVLDRKGEKEQARKIFNKVIRNVADDSYQLRLVANHFSEHQLLDYAKKAFLAGRENEANNETYAIELARVYQLLNDQEAMIDEYLRYAQQDPSHVDMVKNRLQNELSEDEDLDKLADILYERIQDTAHKQLYGELLIWVNLQKKDFEGAFIQARAIDRRNRTGGEEVIRVADIALENGAYRQAVDMYDWVVENFQDQQNFMLARKKKIEAREQLVKNDYPVDTSQVIQLTKDYQNFIEENRRRRGQGNQSTLDALRSKGLLHAFYLDEKDKGIAILKNIIDDSNANKELIGQCKMDLGDIYILTGKPWESTLLYSQVEKSFKDHPLGYEAKLKNAKLSYYKGDFELAQGHLDVLKLATSREIANDAMDLSILIQNNTVFDTTNKAMEAYASVDLLLFQNKQEAALERLDSLLNAINDHELIDEIHWSMARVYRQMGNYSQAIAHLDKIQQAYANDILGDNALFLKGKIQEENLDNSSAAMETYQQFLTQYKGSIHVAEVRKRFRSLRGDLIN